jgi:hypothetical protein
MPAILERDAGRKITVATRPLPKSSPASVVEVQAAAGAGLSVRRASEA